ncbi:MAG TPA: phosphate acyltransferase PlsX [Longimicrobiales bacterium]|nr:phosphate acyltransferase PlsX [Longimicrobiales bacterium]
MRIALDAMGTDRHPAVEVEGAVLALRELAGDFELLLVGDRERIEAELERYTLPPGRLTVVHAADVIEPGEPAVTAVRRKPDSSIVVGLRLQKDGKADAFVSAGSTGAVMAASLFLFRALPGVDRPAIGTILPTTVQPCLLIDAGANVDCKPQHLLQFARLGSIYVEDVWQRPAPRIGLLNIGEEPEKGDELTVEAHRLLRESDLNFIGNIEGRDVIRGTCDVLVTDGFVGNVLLKFYESVMGFMHGLLTTELAEHPDALDLDHVFRVFDYTEYGGAPLLGVNGVTIICHGGSPPRAICNAIRVAAQAVDARVVGHIERAVASAAAQGSHREDS